MNQLIRCPHCALGGIITTVGKLVDDYVVIQTTLSQGRREFTIVKGNDFILICGKCGHEVFIRKEVYESSNIGEKWVHWVSFNQGTIGQGIQRLGDISGTPLQSQGSNGVFYNGTT